MRRISFDMDVLRSFVTGVELASFAKAAQRLGRSTSAVSAQMQKLEEQVGAPILRKVGRGMLPTATGEALLAYARRLLELNDEAASAVRGVELAGSVRLGMQEDFGERILTDVLGRFARAHPKVRIEAMVARNTALLERMAAGQLDLALAWDSGVAMPHSQLLGRVPMRWIAAASAEPVAGVDGEPLPLVLFESPCLMRTAAIEALERAGMPWRVAFSSPSLGGVWAAVAAGLGVTVRTEIGLPPGLRALGHAAAGLPPLPRVDLVLHRAAALPDPTTQRLRDSVLHAVAPLIPV
ncbi:DNA-binding transcriptional LysR family regulator [Janthinobacterium sp. CG_S6]|nr:MULTISPECIES: LysR substrate-binding domain-containing protein [unclassified Janthinobacterium]MEC5160672.1 DNA-binding transcriptional LysR family regulator [Janthinobacterium sp. CG_S6]